MYKISMNFELRFSKRNDYLFLYLGYNNNQLTISVKSNLLVRAFKSIVGMDDRNTNTQLVKKT